MGEFQDQVAESCTDYFNRYRRQTYVTPKSYLSFLMGYKKIYAEKRKTIGVLADRMNTGMHHRVHGFNRKLALTPNFIFDGFNTA
jgi:dynein heavy chain